MQKHLKRKDQLDFDFGDAPPFYATDEAATTDGRDPDYELESPLFYETAADGASFIDARYTAKDHELITELPSRNSTLHMIGTGRTSGWHLLEHLRKLAARPIRSLWISTLSMSLANVEALAAALDSGDIRRCSLVASCYFKSTNDEIWHRVFSELTARGQPVAGIRSHAKVSVLQFTARRWFVIETSANLRSSGNLEQYTITHSEQLGRFHAGWIDDAIREACRFQ